MDSVTTLIQTLSAKWDQQTKQVKYMTVAATTSIPLLAYVLRNLYWSLYRRQNSLPPGPNGLPFIGMGLTWHSDTKSRIDLSKKYGPIFYAQYFGFPCFVISTSKLVKQLFTQKQFLNRLDEQAFDPKMLYQPSTVSVGESQALPMIMVDGHSWTKRRKLTQNTLFKTLNNKYLGNLLKQTLEGDVRTYLDNIIASNNGQWMNSRDIFDFIALNTIYSAIFGEKLDFNSDLYPTLRNMVNDIMKWAVTDILVTNVPFVKYVYGQKLLKYRTNRDDVLFKLVEDRVNSAKDKDAEKSYIDHMHEMVINDEITKDEEIADLLVLFIAGMETTSNTLQFGVTLLAKYPNIQEKVRTELGNVMGNEYDIKLINKCPIFRAVVHEILRISSIAFMGVERGSYTDYWLTMDDGTKYKIPKGVNIFTNVDCIHIKDDNREESWKKTNGDEIILDNFLIKNEEDDTMRFVKNESFIAFGVGKRNCVGQMLAMKELYFTLGYLLINYKVSLTNKRDGDKDVTLMRNASSQTVCLDPVIPITIDRI